MCLDTSGELVGMRQTLIYTGIPGIFKWTSCGQILSWNTPHSFDTVLIDTAMATSRAQQPVPSSFFFPAKSGGSQCWLVKYPHRAAHLWLVGSLSWVHLFSLIFPRVHDCLALCQKVAVLRHRFSLSSQLTILRLSLAEEASLSQKSPVSLQILAWGLACSWSGSTVGCHSCVKNRHEESWAE